MKRGFKAHAKRLAVELRAEIGASADGPFDPWQLADLYGVKVYKLSQLDCPDPVLAHFTAVAQAAFSGALIPLGHGAIILENDSHALVRRRVTMSHELAHVTLEHRFGTSIVTDRACRLADPGQEEEANELAGELLVPFDTALRLARTGATDEIVAAQFMISERAAAWRMNSSGARTVAERQRAAYLRRSVTR